MLHDRGDNLVLIARSKQRQTELQQSFNEAQVLVADLNEPEGLERSIHPQELPAKLDSVIHAAGVVQLGGVAELDAEQWLSNLNVNLVSAAILSKIALPALRQNRGQIVFVNSGAGLRTHPQWAAYAASKHGLKALADALRAEEAPSGVRVSSIYPGRTATPMQEQVVEHEGGHYDPDVFIQPESVAKAICDVLDMTPDAALTDVTIRPAPRS